MWHELRPRVTWPDEGSGPSAQFWSTKALVCVIQNNFCVSAAVVPICLRQFMKY